MWHNLTPRLIKCANCQLVRCAATSAQLTEPEPKVEVKEAKKTKKAEEKPKLEWEQKIADFLSVQLAREHRRYSSEKKKKRIEHIVICHIRDQKIVPLLSYLVRLVQSKEVIGGRVDYSEVFASSLKHISKHLSRIANDHEYLQSNKAIPFFHNLFEILPAIPMTSDDSISAIALTLARLEELTTIPDNLKIKRSKVVGAVQKRLTMATSTQLPKQNRIFFNDAEYEVISNYIQCGFDRIPMEETPPNLKYSDTPLAETLNTPCQPVDYQGNPFISQKWSKKEFRQKFLELLDREQRYCIQVENFSRNSIEKPMERLLEEWKWRDAIKGCFDVMRNKVSQVNVKLFINGLDAAKVADRLYECVIVALCTGQKVLAIPELESAMAHALLDLAHSEFTANVLESSTDLFTEVYDKYLQYFDENSTIPREYTQREWWYKCAEEARVDPNFHIPMGGVSKASTEELGEFLVSVVMNACYVPPSQLRKKKRGNIKAFSFRNVNIDEKSDWVENAYKINVNKMIQVHPALVELLDIHQFKHLLFPFRALPTTLPPRPWMDKGLCGPMYTKESEPLRNLYEFKDCNVNVEMRKRLRNEAQGRPVFDALNDLGSTPWILNQATLKELIHAFDLSFKPDQREILENLAIPMHPSTVKVPTFEEEFGVHKKVADVSSMEFIQFSKKQYEASKEQNETNSLWYWLMYRLVLARHFRDEMLYFPHNMDFRGRVYPISPHLNHMGDDINRSLLKFARGKPMGKKGFEWLKLHCINLTGLMKRQSVEERLAYAEENLGTIIDSAENPWNGTKWWMSSEDPWQTLAACMEIRDVISSGIRSENYVSHLPIHQDGSCNGFQHYAAMGRDLKGAAEVNLLPSDRPADIYSSVAARVEQKRLQHEESDDEKLRALARDLRDHLPQEMPRKVIKQTVMTTVYGVTRYGAVLQVKKQLKALGIPGEKLGKFTTYIADMTLDSLNESFQASMQMKDWFRSCVSVAVKLMRPIEWTTPLGLPVAQPYVKAARKHNKLCLMPILSKQTNAFPPNFVHSLDSTHMMLTALNCKKHGLTFAAVHDCFWTHSCDVDKMNEICREQFINLHSSPIVENLANDLRVTFMPPSLLRLLDLKSLNEFEQKLTPNIEKGELDLNCIKDSIYFFS
ncbi:unnamed protein product [Bursaphelenchus okinawaensis]|uniref:DNA-directed RNA polymerase n=1 Tax=Bursaphelenchus okinawaensis TaxID=465554 RepID=A0A811KNL9_9BILA|nr:unnamed protein product [Bursaphelenchus okinawaensis]CAG9107357.1 unnamed protein product [Bursaphelenchus okinawaensis]